MTIPGDLFVNNINLTDLYVHFYYIDCAKIINKFHSLSQSIKSL